MDNFKIRRELVLFLFCLLAISSVVKFGTVTADENTMSDPACYATNQNGVEFQTSVHGVGGYKFGRYFTPASPTCTYLWARISNSEIYAYIPDYLTIQYNNLVGWDMNYLRIGTRNESPMKKIFIAFKAQDKQKDYFGIVDLKRVPLPDSPLVASTSAEAAAMIDEAMAPQPTSTPVLPVDVGPLPTNVQIDKFPITNAQMKEFQATPGFWTPEFWSSEIEWTVVHTDAGREDANANAIPWHLVTDDFIMESEYHGSWYIMQKYCESVGKRLPTTLELRQAKQALKIAVIENSFEWTSTAPQAENPHSYEVINWHSGKVTIMSAAGAFGFFNYAHCIKDMPKK